jgi:AbrB family looped-hinge helix DNA binding protein
MAALKLSVVQEKGQVTIPAEIRKKLGLKKGDQVGRILREKGLTLEEFMESGREIRGKLVEDEYESEAEE